MRLICFLLLVCLALSGCSGPASVTDGPYDEKTAARRLYVAKCAKCHKFYDPAKYSDQEWEKWMTKMSKKAKLKPEQEAMLARYIEDTYRAPQRTNSAGQKP
jgi:uncharacterized protein YceK